MICLKSSIGGYAPYFSTAGMLMSSTKMRDVYPPGDPNVLFPTTFSSFDSIVDCVVFESV